MKSMDSDLLAEPLFACIFWRKPLPQERFAQWWISLTVSIRYQLLPPECSLSVSSGFVAKGMRNMPSGPATFWCMPEDSELSVSIYARPLHAPSTGFHFPTGIVFAELSNKRLLCCWSAQIRPKPNLHK